ncbi:unnamed protein product [Prorocentrum cordatum]|uniref:Uncharacterized protein n=1 Tax=Prorocentrum cordatum TaxID=2364126 RepID=A0ABN9SGG8_9DINO|nr:unnamed protein product [Polarella glacialis]
MSFRTTLLAVLPSSCAAISHKHAASARDVGFLDEVTEDELMYELMSGLPGYLETDGDDCKMAEQGSPCYEDVTWLQTKGFEKHPEWYPGYTARSSFEEVQDMLYRLGKAQCPKPCFSKVLDVDHGAESTNLVLSSGCVDAVEGDLCYRTVRWLKRTGLEQHPDWFPTLEAGSSTAAIQAELHRQGKSQCPKPCEPVEAPSYHALSARKSGLRARVGSEGAASWMWDFPKEEVVPTTEAGRAVMQCLRKLLHVTPENFDDLRAECEGLVPADGATQRDALVKESVRFISWAQHHVVDMRIQRKAEEDGVSTASEAVNPAAQAEVGEDGCMNALRNSVCYTAVSYGLSEGIRKHPTMYEGLSEHSSFEKVQEFLWRNNRHGCTKPCPRKRVDITEFDKHPEMLTYKKSVADMSIDEMTRYINGEWDGYQAKMFDNRDDDPLPTANPKPVAEETNEDKSVQDMSTDELARVLDGDMVAYMPKEVANDTEPEKAANDSAEVASVSTANDSTPLFADIASINMSQMSEVASAVDVPAQPVADAPTVDAVADVPVEPVADVPTEHETAE